MQCEWVSRTTVINPVSDAQELQLLIEDLMFLAKINRFITL